MWSYASPIAFKIAPASPAILALYNTLRKICASYQWVQLPSDPIDNFLCMTLQKTNQLKKTACLLFPFREIKLIHVHLHNTSSRELFNLTQKRLM